MFTSLKQGRACDKTPKSLAVSNVRNSHWWNASLIEQKDEDVQAENICNVMIRGFHQVYTKNFYK